MTLALAVFRDVGNRGGEVEVLNETGTLHRLRGEPAEAQAHHRQALDVARAIGSALDEAHALAGLGRCALAAADPCTAQANLGQAAEIFQRIGAPEAPSSQPNWQPHRSGVRYSNAMTPR